MDLWESIQHEAMQAVVDPDDEAWIRRVCRFYSRTFHTPLHLVRELPLEDVLLAYFEELFEGLSEEDREERIEFLLATPEERKKLGDREKVLGERDDAFLDNLNKAVESGEMIERPKKPKAAKLDEAVELPPKMAQLAKKVARTRERAQKMAGNDLPAPKPKKQKVEAPPTLGDLPEISMNFGGETGGNLPSGSPWADLDPLAPPRKPRKT